MKKYITLLLLLVFASCHKENIKDKPRVPTPYYDKAWSFSDKGMVDSSFVYFNKAKEESLKQGDSILVAKSLINMAIISGDQGDYFGSQELSLSAIKYLNISNAKQKEILSSNYNNLGKMAHLLKNYDEATSFYIKAIALSNNEQSKIIYANNIAINLSAQKRYHESLKYFEQLLRNKDVQKSNNNFSRILSNISKTRWLQNPNYNAAPDLLRALHIREKENDLWGQNASFSHLSDYYYKKQPDSALFYSRKMYWVAKEIKSPDDQLQALQKLVKLSHPEETKQYFGLYQKLEDSVQTARNAAKNQFAVIRYETEKNKADNLLLQKDNTEKKYQIIKQKIVSISTIFVLVAASIIAVLWYKKRKQRLELEAQTAIRENQLKTSKKVHDVVANGLYRVMTEIENQEEIDKDRVLDKIEDLYEKSRDISYEEVKFTDQNFHERVSELIKSFATDTTKVALAGNDPQLWKKVTAQVKYEIENILQELMVNMGKHSGASNVAVRFEQKQNKINIYYTDNGIGMPEEMRFNNGLRNTGTRIESIHGEITFDTKVEKGLKIQISFPIT
ncbi:tetratricopeptide repeat-containing sensor histidine kinase [Pedobacter sp.]|uniref:tetratricopeptide repeat-containing sensor histidine kinase n=1 Tax=Pedobacter sp. TaxID=1411316 RepID=UPI002CD841A5|nr:tetratricopeptide repeat protein [Pedobacter sp.]HWW37901.1 tetratricopeptide repeat protein [Pedobacter sp.]